MIVTDQVPDFRYVVATLDTSLPGRGDLFFFLVMAASMVRGIPFV